MDAAETPVGAQATSGAPDKVSDRRQAELVLDLDDIIGRCPETAKYRMLERFLTRESGGSPRPLPITIAVRIPYTWASERLIEVESRGTASGRLLGSGSLVAALYYFDASGTAQDVLKLIAGNQGLDILRAGDFTTTGYRISLSEEGGDHIIMQLLAGEQHLVTVSELMTGKLDALCGVDGVDELIDTARSNIESITGAGAR